MLMYLAAVFALLTPPAATAVAGSSERGCEKTTIFGRVQVDDSNLQEATEEGEAARLAAMNVLGIRDPRFTITDADLTSHKWGDQSVDGTPIYVWQFRKKTSGTQFQAPPAYILRHEIGHDLFIRHLVPGTKEGQYGGDAPDWLDETAAVAFEGEALRSTRRRSTVRYARKEKLIPLQRFLTMIHPEMEAGSIPASSDLPVTAFEPTSEDTPLFYAMASSFYDFLVSRTGNPAIVVELAAAFRRDEPLEKWILARTGHSGSIQALNAEFLAWIASDPRYGGAA